jgi:hypothetical protein
MSKIILGTKANDAVLLNSPNVPYDDLVSQQLSDKKMKVTENLNFFIFCQFSFDVQAFQDPLYIAGPVFFSSNYEKFVSMKETRKNFAVLL